MSKDARNDDLDLPSELREQFDRLVSSLAKQGFGEDGPPRETTFAQIEQFGHRVGRMMARAVDARLVEQHATCFAGEEPCPTCGQQHSSRESPHKLPLQTEDGEVTLREPTFRCSTCGRDFFPSTLVAQD